MKEEENVYGGTPDTEEVAAASVGAEDRKDAEKEVSTVLGKFKDVGALARAYGSLQAEFTRRSQKLKELERQAENLKAEAEGSGAEKLRKNAEARRAETKKFDAFVRETEKRPEAKQPLETAEEAPPKPSELETEAYGFTAKTDAGAISGREAIPSVAKSGDPTFSSEELYERAKADEKVRLKIIGEYLASLKKPNAPLTVGGAGTLAAPPVRAKSIGDAGVMALSYFKKASVVE